MALILGIVTKICFHHETNFSKLIKFYCSSKYWLRKNKAQKRFFITQDLHKDFFFDFAV